MTQFFSKSTFLLAPALGLALATGVLAASPGPAPKGGVSKTAGSYPGHNLASQAKITLEAARAIALSARSGRIKSQELEREKGGSGLRYSFDIKVGAKIYEVGVDAADGKVLENKAGDKD